MPAQYDERFPYRTELEMPVVGIEAEFKVFIDGEAVQPEAVWKQPSGFIERPLLKRTNKSSQLPTGGAVYFDGGVLEVVTPVIELAPQCTARVTRSLWEQLGFVRDELTKWEERSGRKVRLEAFSCHFNVSFEMPREERTRNRTIQKLALLLAHLLPVPVTVAGLNRRSTSVGVRPRRDRLELTLDFIPDPGLMAATAALIVGVVREVIGWPSYNLNVLDELPLAIPAGVEPGKHTTRKGWMLKDFHYPRSPFVTDINAPVWVTTRGNRMSYRQMALETATYFRDSIRKLSDPFSYRLLFSILRGETPSLLELPDRPPAYEDVGRLTRWGTVLPELKNFAALMDDGATVPPPFTPSMQRYIAEREEERRRFLAGESDEVAVPAPRRRRRSDLDEKLAPPWRGESTDRREPTDDVVSAGRRSTERRRPATTLPAQQLTRSAYESVFIKLASGGHLKLGDEILTPVAVKGWYHSVFRSKNGEERLLSIDQLLEHIGSWQE
jgi:hypothetical protein